jgi:RimJ/RimL family protein N-acetyltransferase
LHARRVSTDEITPAEQAAWWDSAPRRAWLFGDDGFGYIKREGGVNWITLGITEAARGQGLGALIYRTLSPAYAKIKTDNVASIRAATKAGYLRVYGDEEAGFVVMTSAGC